MEFTTVAKIEQKRRRHAAAFAKANVDIKHALGKGWHNPAKWRVQSIVEILETIRAFPALPGMPAFWSELQIGKTPLPTSGAFINGLRYVPTAKAVVYTTPETEAGGGVTLDLDRVQNCVVLDPITRKRKDIRRAVASLMRGNSYGFVLNEAQNAQLDELIHAVIAMRKQKTAPFLILKGKTYDIRKPYDQNRPTNTR